MSPVVAYLRRIGSASLGVSVTYEPLSHLIRYRS